MGDSCKIGLVLATGRVSYKKQEQHTFRQHMGSPTCLHGVNVAHRFSLLFIQFIVLSILDGPFCFL